MRVRIWNALLTTSYVRQPGPEAARLKEITFGKLLEHVEGLPRRGSHGGQLGLTQQSRAQFPAHDLG